MTGRRDLRALVRGLVLVVAAVVVAGPASEAALSGQWCGTITTTDRLPSVTGRSIRVVLTFPSDGADRSTELAPRISADVDEIAAWWRGQDAAREPRFDRAPFPCGLQADIFVLRLPGSTASLTPGATRGDRIVDAVYAANGRSQYEKVLVYHDGPVDNADSCGEGAGSPDGAGIAIVYLSACAGVPSAMVAAHELLHAFGALAFSGPPHACPDSRGHPCDSMHDLLYPYAPQTQLGSLSLDVGRDDYYGHSGSWPDTQDSGWLRLVSQQVRLTLAIVGLGSVESDVPASPAQRAAQPTGTPAARSRWSRSREPDSASCGGRARARERQLRRQPPGGTLSHRALRARAFRARRLGVRAWRGDRRRRLMPLGALRPDSHLLLRVAAARHPRRRLAPRRLERWVHGPSADVHAAHEEGDGRASALRQALSQASSVVWRAGGDSPASSARSSPTVPQRSATTSWSWIVSRLT